MIVCVRLFSLVGVIMSLATLTARREVVWAAYQRTLLAQSYREGRNEKVNPLLASLSNELDKLDLDIAGAGPMCSVGRYVKPK